MHWLWEKKMGGLGIYCILVVCKVFVKASTWFLLYTDASAAQVPKILPDFSCAAYILLSYLKASKEPHLFLTLTDSVHTRSIQKKSRHC